MARSPHDRQGNEAFWGVYELGVVAGTLPFLAIAAYEITIGKFDDPGVYEWQILVGPPLWATACAFRVGAGRAAQIALVGWLTAAILWWALWFLLIGIGGGA